MTEASAKEDRGSRRTYQVIAALLFIWGLASGSFIVFNDRIVATLLRRQTAMQFAYEDQITELRTSLDKANTRTALDKLDDESSWRDLVQKSAALSTRVAALEALVTGNPRSAAAAPSDHRADVPANISTRFAALDTRLETFAATLRRRTEATSSRVLAAVEELGFSPSSLPRSVGGPFVPLDGGSSFQSGEHYSALKDAVARRQALEAIAARLPLRQPVAGPLDVTSGFGARRDPFLGRLAMHTGIDLRGDTGSAVRVVADGIVTISAPEGGYGTMVEVDHGNGYATRYAHLSASLVKVGDRVTAGFTIGQVGTTGRSTGPHLHYEVRIVGEPVDPARYLALAAHIAAE